MSKILITGATGFIGRSVCQILREKNHTLTGVSRNKELRSGPQNIPLYYLPEFSGNMDWSKAVAGADAIVHLAARVHQMRDRSADPLSEFRRVNMEGTKTLAEAAVAAGVKRFIFLSTIKVNGQRTIGKPFSENDLSAPDDPYGISKWEAENILVDIATKGGMETVILRSPLVYGPHVGGNFMSLARAVAKRWPLPLSAVTNRRSLIYVGNLASAIATCVSHPNAPGEIFFVSDGETLSTAELAKRMALAAGIRGNIFYCPLWALHTAGVLTGRQQTINRITESLEVDSSKIRRVLNWSAPYSVEKGLTETMLSINKLIS